MRRGGAGVADGRARVPRARARTAWPRPVRARPAAALDVALDAECLRQLDEASAVAPGYPHDFLGRSNVRNSVFGGMYDALDLRR